MMSGTDFEQLTATLGNLAIGGTLGIWGLWAVVRFAFALLITVKP